MPTPDPQYTPAREHAERASRLLDSVAAAEQRISARHEDPVAALSDANLGVTGAFNADQHLRVTLASAESDR